jgi:Glycosyl transferase family 11
VQVLEFALLALSNGPTVSVDMLSRKQPVVTGLNGGLGNQMFQYAAGRALALRCGAPLKLDLSRYVRDGKRRYELGALSICATPAGKADLARFTLQPDAESPWRARLKRCRYGIVRAAPVYNERHFHFDADVLALRAPVYLSGYWQTEKYFAEFAAALRRELAPREGLEPENAAIAAAIDATNAVSLHVRRGDYVTEPRTSRYHGVCSIDYFRAAAEFIEKRAGAIHLFVFSDDQEWCRDNLALGMPTTFVAANSPDRGFRDMQLMARCRHHVIANSSFSWWGAWLNPSPTKIVVAPQRWFDAGSADTRDLIPASWVRL